MRIGIDASRANLAHRTGTEWYAFHLTRAFFALLRPTDEVLLYVKEPLRPEWGSLPSNVKVRVLGWPPKRLWTQLRLSWELVWHRVDVLFVPAHTIPFISPRRTVTTLHDIGFMHEEDLYGKAELDYHKFSAKLAVKRCSTILTVSEYSKQDICKTFNIDSERVKVIPNSYNKEAFNASVRDNKNLITDAQKQAGVRQPYIMTIGRIEKKKNTLGLVKAFAILKKQEKFKNYQLLLVGASGLGADEIRKACNTLGISSDVIWPGWLPEAVVPALMAGAEAFVLPSFFEGFGIPVLEAMACGTPVICSNVTSLPEVAGGAAILVDPQDPQAIASGIEKVCSNPALAAELLEKGYQRVKSFSWESSARLLAEVLL
jgi:glycosyltransferase involved in cell wall biosynthesis